MTQKVFNSENFSFAFYKQEMRKSLNGRGIANENKPFKETKTWVHNLYYIRQSVCKSGIAILVYSYI